nr:restriction endonuclease subunit S [Parabacteroides goldsteinii]
MDTKKLRQKILDLAIRGKLVPQDPNDEPASVLLERIKAEKERLIKEGKIKRSKKQDSSDTSHYRNVPFEVPSSWVWCKLDDLAFYKKGPFGSSLTKSMFVPKVEDVFKVYEQKNAIQKDETLGSYYITKERYESLSGFAVQPFDIIVSCAGTIGETYVLSDSPMAGVINQALMLIRLYNREIEPFYLLYFDFILKEEAHKESKGTAIKNIPPFDVLKNFYIPLPPIEEQKRIIDETNKWLNIVNGIEMNSRDLSNTVIQAKFKILDLAITGKLVSQDPADEPAFQLLKRINPDFIPCDNTHNKQLPQSWCVCQLKDICSKIVDGDHNPPTGEPNKTKYMMLSAQNIANGRIIEIDKARYLSKDKFELCDKRTQIRKEDLLVTIVGTLGRTCIFDSCEYITFQRSVACLTTFIFNGYLKHFIDSPYTQNYIAENARGTAQKGFYLNQLEKLTVVIPPLMEQLRIVAEISKLFSVLDNIQNSLEV